MFSVFVVLCVGLLVLCELRERPWLRELRVLFCLFELNQAP